MNSRPLLKELPAAEGKPAQAQIQPPAPLRPAQDQGEPEIPAVLPILPVRNLVLFPGLVIPLSVGRPDSIKLLEDSLPQSKVIGVIAQRAAETDSPKADDL